MADYQDLGGGYSVANLRIGMVIRNPLNKEVYIQPGDDSTMMQETLDSFDEISDDVADAKRAVIVDMSLSEYFA